MLLIVRISSLPKIIEEYLNFYNCSNEDETKMTLHEVERKASGTILSLCLSVFLIRYPKKGVFWDVILPRILILPKSFLTWSLVQPEHYVVCMCRLHHFKNSQEKCFSKSTTDSNPDHKSLLSIPKIEWVLQTEKKIRLNLKWEMVHYCSLISVSDYFNLKLYLIASFRTQKINYL